MEVRAQAFHCHVVGEHGLDKAAPLIQSGVESAKWVMPIAWCAVTSAIIVSGLAVPLEGGLEASGFGFFFPADGQGDAYTRSIAPFSAAAAVLGAAFMFIPKMTNWRIRKGLAWSTFMLMVFGGIMMLIAPQAFVAIARANGGAALGMAVDWSVVWMDAGARISVAGGLLAVATFVDAWAHRARGYSPASSS
jgi:hypothetical protein